MATGYYNTSSGAVATNPLAPSGGGFSGGKSAPGPGIAAPPMSSFDAAKNALMQYNSPTLAGYGAQYGNGIAQLGYQQGMFDNAQSGAQLDYQGQLGDLNTSIDNNALQQARSAMDAQAYGNMMGYNSNVYDAQRGGLLNAFNKSMSDINSDATAKGAFTATGTQKNRGYAYGDWLSNQNALYGNFQQQQETLGMRKGNAETQTQILARTAQNLGTKPALLQAQLQNGLEKLGIQNQISVGTLLNGIQQGNFQALQLMHKIVIDAGTLAGQM